MPKSSIDTAVFPVAGMGTRFLPVTKAGPKEMLPIVDKPVIHYAVEEAVNSGIKHLVFITSSSKRAIEDYFDSNFELELRLEERRKFEELEMVKNILPSNVTISYVRQNAPLGLGHAVLCARHLVGNKPFAVLLPDDVIDCPNAPCLKSMIDHHEKTGASVVAIEEVEASQVGKYGVVAIENWQQRFANINNIVEKPKLADAPSRFAVTGRYILAPEIFDLLTDMPRGAGGEYQLTDAIKLLLSSAKVDAYLFEGKRYDCGSILGLLQASLVFALRRNELREPLFEEMRKIIDSCAVIG